MAIFDYLNSLPNISISNKSDIPFNVSVTKFAKGDIILDYGQIEKHGYFMLKGIAYASIHTKSYDLRILHFFFPNAFFNGYSSFIAQKPSITQIVAATNCEVEVVNYNEIKILYSSSLMVNQIGRQLTEMMYIRKTLREIDFLTKSAQERYEDLVKIYPEVIQEISINKIAMYLGIQPESLSRIRKKAAI